MIPVQIVLPGVTLGSAHDDEFIITYVEGLIDSVDPSIEDEQRENGHGDYGQADIWQTARKIQIEGNYSGPDQFGAGNVLKSLTGKHFEATFVLPNGTFRAEVVLSSRVRWQLVGFDGADFEFTLKADDPRLYGPLQTLSTGVPSPGVGLADPILDPLQVGEVVEVARNRYLNPRFVNPALIPAGAVQSSDWSMSGGFSLFVPTITGYGHGPYGDGTYGHGPI